MQRRILERVGAVALLLALVACSADRASKPEPGPRDVVDPDGGSSTADASAPPHEQPMLDDAGSALPDEVLPDECLFGCDTLTSPQQLPVATADQVPPAISGGTLLTTRDAKWLVAADPDRDKLYFIDLAREALSHERALPAGSEPGRVIEDGGGRIHVALRGRGALLSLERAPDSQMTERALCAQPRGLAYDAAHDSVHVACADGKLVTIAAAADGGIMRTLDLGRDLRDVLVRGDELLVTRFRAAELLRVGADGAISQRMLPPSALLPGSFDPITSQPRPAALHTPNVAWRAIDIAGQSALLHQRSRTGEIATTAGGYGIGNCDGIVQAALTVGLDAERAATVDLGDAALAVDLAANPSGTVLAVASPGNWGTGSQLSMYSLTGLSPLNPRATTQALQNLFRRGVTQRGASETEPACMTAQSRFPAPKGQITSVAFVSDNRLALLEREPAAVSIVHLPSLQPQARIELAQPSRYDTGHALFHMRTFAGIACASCHAEAGDDGHVWLFQGIGERRTQSLRGGILGSEPFHWDGDMKDFDALVHEVFVERMSAGRIELSQAQSSALARWIDEQPLWAAAASDPAQALRGKELFEASTVGCTGCHSGPLFTDNKSVDVGTGSPLQVPALRGVSFRLPVMHNGCAQTLRQRFDVACGGERHGDTTMLNEAQLSDLIAYLETL